jgi:outer membrane receptor protein involved in Fe transport
MSVFAKSMLAASGAAALMLGSGGTAMSQTTLPQIEVIAPTRAQPAPRPKPRVTAAKPRTVPAAAAPAQRATTRVTTAARQATPPATPQPTEAQVVAGKNEKFDQARRNILAPIGAASHEMTRQDLEALPQGTNATLDKALLQAPGVSQDSAASGELHVRNEHGNIQYRINGIMLPDGVGAFGQILDTGIAGKIDLLTGALPAQYGLRTAGVVDIQTRTDAFNNSGKVSAYGGSHETITPSYEYGGTAGQTQYFVSGRYFGSNLGIENPTPAREAIHDHTSQEKGFLYLSTVLDPTSRLTLISGVSNAAYQIPNNPGQPSNNTAFGVSSFDSSRLNERQYELTQFNVLAYQKSVEDIDYQIAYFNRYNQLHFRPDLIGDLVINGVASDVYRQSATNGIQEDTAWRIGYAHTLRFGFSASAERSLVTDISTALALANPTDPGQGTIDQPSSIFDSSSKTGWLLGAYVQDEWKMTNNLTLNAGLRFDQMYQYVNANQLSPRVSLTWKPFDSTTFHAGYARNFTPPPQVVAAPVNLALVQGTSQQPAVQQNDPVLPERSHVFDVGVVQKILPVPGLEVGIDGYYKIARDLLDDGQFGQAYVLSGFNYDRANNLGVELKASYTNGNFRAYGNLAWARQLGTDIVSNQYLFDPERLAYIASHYIYTDHSQILTASAGASYLWNGTRFSASMIYGSGLRSGFANTDHVPSYTQVNTGISHEFLFPGASKPTTVRFDVVNLFDKIYQIRDGSGIGVFAPQYGPRRGFFVGISQKL